MYQKKVFLILCLICVGQVFGQTLIRQLKISPDGSRLAFSYHGDIWVYSFINQNAKRVTLHQAYESDPVWKPNGEELAFSSNRKGNYNVFKISAEGGLPKQLTYYPTKNTPTDWSDDKIIFTTKRVYQGPEWDSQIYFVKETGGTPERLITAYGSMFSISPDKNLIAYTKGSCKISREDYSGSAQKDIWVYNQKIKKYHQITTSIKNDHSPLWDEKGNIYYIGAKSGRYNIYKQSISKTGQKIGTETQLTFQKVNGVRSFSISNNGKIVYTTGIDTYILEKGKSRKISLKLPLDNRFDLEETKTTNSDIRNYAISPDAKLIALEIDGEIFVKENNKENKKTNNISKHFSKDKMPQWIDDKTVIYISDRNGYDNIYSATSSDTLVKLSRSLSINTERLTNTKIDIDHIIISPDKKKIAYTEGRGKLIIAELKQGKIENPITFSDTWASANDLSWSPDSKYIAFSQEDLNFDNEIFIQSVEDKNKKINVSMHPRADMSPVWSSDGKKLAFLSNRSGMNYDVWMVWLQKEDWEKTKIDHEEGDYYEKVEENKKNKKKDKKENKRKVKVRIDEDKIYDRLVQVTSLSGDEYSLAFNPDSEFLYFSATNPVSKGRNLYKVKWDGSKPKEVKGGKKAKDFYELKDHLYFVTSGKLKKLNAKSDKVENLLHKATYTINYEQQRKQVFEEGIRALTNRFYDPEFHGYDWKALVERYRPWVLSASTQQDYTYMFNLLLGQLNASHMGYRGKNPEKVKSDNIGLLGLEVSDIKNGVKINHVLTNSEADKSNSKLKVGDIITAINGKKITKGTNFYSLLKNTLENEILVTLATNKNIVVRPQSSLLNLQYEQWIRSRKKLVDHYSKGQLGYIHIKGMNLPSFERFERELKASGYGKKGIVIDVRYNGGGWTTDRLMAVLNVTQHAYTIPRGATKSLKNHKEFSNNYPFNERAILSVNRKPLVALCNENSYSNAEIFAHAFKNLNIGKLVGQPTFGAVISTGGKRLQNGMIRMPFRAWYVKKSDKNMENEAPATPDFLVKNHPGWKSRGEDAQLKKAVEVLLEELNQ